MQKYTLIRTSSHNGGDGEEFRGYVQYTFCRRNWEVIFFHTDVIKQQ
jgi:hypothetical protein